MKASMTINEAANAATSGAAVKALTNLFPGANQTQQIMSFLRATKDSQGMSYHACACSAYLICQNSSALSCIVHHAEASVIATLVPIAAVSALQM